MVAYEKEGNSDAEEWLKQFWLFRESRDGVGALFINIRAKNPSFYAASNQKIYERCWYLHFN